MTCVKTVVMNGIKLGFSRTRFANEAQAVAGRVRWMPSVGSFGQRRSLPRPI